MSVTALLRRLRPPCARSTILVHGFAQEAMTNPGYTVRFPATSEPVVAMGDGKVTQVTDGRPFWRSSHAVLRDRTTYSVTIDHGHGVETVVGGLGQAEVNAGTLVHRGQRLGVPLTLEVFFAVRVGGNAKHPVEINRHFKVYDQRYVVGQHGTLRFAPDVVNRDLAGGFLATLQSGWRYFYDLLSSRPYLLNVDFNGSGAKVGPAAIGMGDEDYWTTYTPVNFSTSLDYSCGYGIIFSSTPVVWLSDYRGVRTAARIEKLVEPPSPFYGAATSWDPMLASWIGGYSGLIPVETFFVVKGLPSGNLRVLLYANQGNTTFMVSVDNGTIASQGNAPSVVPDFAEGVNYAEFPVTLGVGSFLTVKVFGYLSGMQIIRVGS